MDGKGQVAQSSSITRIWHPLYRFLTLNLADERISTKRLIAISIEKGYISIASGMRILSKIMIKSVKRYSIEEDRYPDHNELVSFLKIFLNETGTGRCDIAIHIPKKWIVIRTLSFPSSVKENLAGVISYEMDRLTPFGPEEAFYDFRIINEDTNLINILLAAVRADIVIPYINAFKEAGFNITSVGISLSSIEALLRYMAEDTRESVIARIDDSMYECGVFIDGLMHEAYTNELTGDIQKHLVTDISTLIDSAKIAGRAPKVIMLINGNEHIRQHIESTTSIPVRIIDRTRFDYYGGGAFIASGGVIESLRNHSRPLNLLKKGVSEDDKPSYILTIILIVAFIISIGFYIVAPLKIEKRRLEAINRQLVEKEEEVKKIEALKKEIEAVDSEVSIINNFKNSRPSTMTLLKELTSILPKKAWLTGLTIKEDTLEINGYATSATELLPILDSSRLYSKVEFASPTVRDATMNSDRFRIKMQIGEQKDEKK